jgi:hypothetical protein
MSPSNSLFTKAGIRFASLWWILGIVLAGCSNGSGSHKTESELGGNYAPAVQALPKGNFDRFFFHVPKRENASPGTGLGTLTIKGNEQFFGSFRSNILVFKPGVDLKNLAFSALSSKDEKDLLAAGSAIKLVNNEKVFALGTSANCGDVRFRQFRLVRDNSLIYAPVSFFKPITSPPGPDLAVWKASFNRLMTRQGHPNLRIGLWKPDNEFAHGLVIWYWNFNEPGLTDLQSDKAGADVATMVYSERKHIVHSIIIKKVGNGDDKTAQSETFELAKRATVQALYPDLDETGSNYLLNQIDNSEAWIEDKKGWAMQQIGNEFTVSVGFLPKH